MLGPPRPAGSSHSPTRDAPADEHTDEDARHRGDDDDCHPGDFFRRRGGGADDGRRGLRGRRQAWRAAPRSTIDSIDVDRVPVGEVVSEGTVADRNRAVLVHHAGPCVTDARNLEPSLHLPSRRAGEHVEAPLPALLLALPLLGLAPLLAARLGRLPLRPSRSSRLPCDQPEVTVGELRTRARRLDLSVGGRYHRPDRCVWGAGGRAVPEDVLRLMGPPERVVEVDDAPRSRDQALPDGRADLRGGDRRPVILAGRMAELDDRPDRLRCRRAVRGRAAF